MIKSGTGEEAMNRELVNHIIEKARKFVVKYSGADCSEIAEDLARFIGVGELISAIIIGDGNNPNMLGSFKYDSKTYCYHTVVAVEGIVLDATSEKRVMQMDEFISKVYKGNKTKGNRLMVLRGIYNPMAPEAYLNPIKYISESVALGHLQVLVDMNINQI